MSQYRNTVFKWFLSRKKPTEAQFKNVWKWLRWKDEKIPIEDIEGFDDLLIKKADTELVEILKDQADKGMKSANNLELVANTPKEYVLPENAYFFGLEITGIGFVTIGTSSSNISDIADITSSGVSFLQTGFIKATSIWMQSDADLTVTPIIFQK